MHTLSVHLDAVCQAPFGASLSTGSFLAWPNMRFPLTKKERKPGLVSFLFLPLSSALLPPFPTFLPPALQAGLISTSSGKWPWSPTSDMGTPRPSPRARLTLPPSQAPASPGPGDGSPTETRRELCSFTPFPPQAPDGGPPFCPQRGDEGELPRGPSPGPPSPTTPPRSALPTQGRRAGVPSDPPRTPGALHQAPREHGPRGKTRRGAAPPQRLGPPRASPLTRAPRNPGEPPRLVSRA